MTGNYEKRITELENKLSNFRHVLTSFVVWTAQSAGSPISHSDAKILLEALDADPEDNSK